jgi:predicted dehydrogenase
VDLVRYVLGSEVTSVVADAAVFVPERLRPTVPTSGHALVADGVPGQVENDDHVSALLRLSSGARVALEASRVAVGEQNAYGFEVHGTTGRLAWDYRRMGALQVSRGPAAQDQPVGTVLVGPGAGDYAAFQPGSGNPMSYDDLKVIEARDVLLSIATGTPQGAGLTDAVRAAVVLDAVAAAAAGGNRVEVPVG